MKDTITVFVDTILSSLILAFPVFLMLIGASLLMAAATGFYGLVYIALQSYPFVVVGVTIYKIVQRVKSVSK